MEKIVIQTHADFTPKGKRSARLVQTDRGGNQLRWYVGGRIYRKLPFTQFNVTLTQEWLAESSAVERLNPTGSYRRDRMATGTGDGPRGNRPNKARTQTTSNAS